MNIAIAGANGRMGRCLIEAVLNNDDARLHAGLVRPGCALIGQEVGLFTGQKTGVLFTSDIKQALNSADILIDFTHPSSTLDHVNACVQHNIGMVIGTTGLDDTNKQVIIEAAQAIPIVFSPNFSVGVNVMFTLLELAARVLGEEYDAEIIEAHHRFKIDAPSGTALQMGEIIASARDTKLSECSVYERVGMTGKRQTGTIGFATVRAGNIVGEHTALFAAPGERFEITHRAESRATFANGAVKAALWLKNRPPGLYTMQEVLGLIHHAP